MNVCTGYRYINYKYLLSRRSFKLPKKLNLESMCYVYWYIVCHCCIYCVLLSVFFNIFLFFQSFEMHILVKTYRSDISSDDACFVDISLFVFLDNHCQIIINASKFFVFKQISNAFLILY